MTSTEVSIRFFERHLKEDILKYGERQAIHMAISALRERDILFEQVRGYCHTCKKNKTDFPCHLKCYGHQRGSAWEWDGGRRLEEV